MKAQNDIEQLADETLNSLNGLQQLEANGFLFAKIQARMQSRKQQQYATVKTLAKLSVALLLFIGLNSVSYYLLNKKRPQSIQQQSTTAQAFANEYNLNVGQYNY
jgi:hypothetical protein